MKNTMIGIRPKCGIEKCNKPHYAKGYCQAHYARIWSSRTGTPTMGHVVGKTPNKKKKGKCTYPDCKYPHYAKSLCHSHYNQIRYAKEASGDEKGCDFPGCKFIHASLGLCHFHYQVLRLNGIAEKIRTLSDFNSEAS